MRWKRNQNRSQCNKRMLMPCKYSTVVSKSLHHYPHPRPACHSLPLSVYGGLHLFLCLLYTTLNLTFWLVKSKRVTNTPRTRLGSEWVSWLMSGDSEVIWFLQQPIQYEHGWMDARFERERCRKFHNILLIKKYQMQKKDRRKKK